MPFEASQLLKANKESLASLDQCPLHRSAPLRRLTSVRLTPMAIQVQSLRSERTRTMMLKWLTSKLRRSSFMRALRYKMAPSLIPSCRRCPVKHPVTLVALNLPSLTELQDPRLLSRVPLPCPAQQQQIVQAHLRRALRRADPCPVLQRACLVLQHLCPALRRPCLGHVRPA
jgi:hypothetical protein